MRGSSSDKLLQEVYSLIPSGTYFTPIVSHPQTPVQQALHTYGNEAGLAILTFENGHADMAYALKTWLDNKSDASATASVQLIAIDLAAVGQELEAIPDVPDAAKAANAALAVSCTNAAAKLQTVFMAAGSDSTLLAAIKTYDASADSFTSAYVALVNLFALNNITFNASEPGSAFQFPASGGL